MCVDLDLLTSRGVLRLNLKTSGFFVVIVRKVRVSAFPRTKALAAYLGFLYCSQFDDFLLSTPVVLRVIAHPLCISLYLVTIKYIHDILKIRLLHWSFEPDICEALLDLLLFKL